jgi:hypothetical protein
MIRPFTCLCFLLACGAGLYLYQTKHRMQMLDREIERTVHATEASRDQTRLLGAEWMLLNDPERLRALSDQFLALRSVTPGQFTTMADLDRHLPAVRSPDAPLEPVPEPDVMTPMVPPPVAAKDNATPATATTEPAAPAPPAPVRPAPVVAERKPPPEKPRVATAQADPKPAAEPKPQAEPRRTQVAAATPPRFTGPITPVVAPMMGGSSLGMASRTSSLPPPVPMSAGPKPVGLFQASDH